MPEHQSLEERWYDLIAPLETLIPILAGAVKFSPSGLVDSSPKGEFLSDHGREFTSFVYHVVRDVHRTAVSAWDLPPKDARHEEFASRAKVLAGELFLIALVARGLMETDPPLELSAHEGLVLLLEHVEKVHDIAEDMEPPRPTRRAS